MSNDKLKSFIKYYKGEDNSPYTNYPEAFFWTAEKAYNIGLSEDVFNDLSTLYINVGGKDIPGMPYGLLITMFSLWGKGQYDIQENIDSFHELAKKW